MKKLLLSMGLIGSLSLASAVATAQAREATENERVTIMTRLGRETVDIEVAEPLPAAVHHDPPRPAPPRPHAVWIPGFWHWEGDRAHGHWLWIGGHFDLEEHDGAIWVEPHYDHVAGGHVHYTGGHWQGSHPH